MYEFVLIIHVLVTVALVTLILLQQGKGAEAGAAFGGGASGTVFGSQGAASFLSRVTAVLAASFFATSLSLSYIATHSATSADIVLPTTSTSVDKKVPNDNAVPVPFDKAASKQSIPAESKR